MSVKLSHVHTFPQADPSPLDALHARKPLTDRLANYNPSPVRVSPPLGDDKPFFSSHLPTLIELILLRCVPSTTCTCFTFFTLFLKCLSYSIMNSLKNGRI